MKRSFKPQVESLEDRMVMDAYAGTHAIYQDIVIPSAPQTSQNRPMEQLSMNYAKVRFEASQPVSGRVTGIVADPMAPKTHSGIVQFCMGDGSVRSMRDGTSNTILVGEKPPSYTPLNFPEYLVLGIVDSQGAPSLTAETPEQAIGEVNNSADSFYGTGVYRSTDVDQDPAIDGSLTAETQKPEPMIAILVGMLLPAVQKVR